MPEKAHIEVREGQKVSAGTLLAKTPREVAGTQDITGGLPRVTEIFEARSRADPAVMAEVAGVVEIARREKRGKLRLISRPTADSGIERRAPRCRTASTCASTPATRQGRRPLVDGPLVPARHPQHQRQGSGAEHTWSREVQTVYRSQRVDIDDKHIEIIVSQMLRKVKVDTMGDTGLLPGSVIDKFAFREVNQELAKCVKIKDKGDSDFAEGTIVPIETLNQTNAQIEAVGGKPAEGSSPSRPPPDAALGHHQGRRADPASSRPPAFRKRPRCLPRLPWRARSTTLWA